MPNKMLVDSTHPEETRVVVLRGTRLEEFDFENAARKQLKGNIYLAKVTRVEPSLQAAFVDYGGNRHGFLAFSEIHPDYYQIPVADRQALIREEEEEAQRHAEDDNTDDAGGEANGTSGGEGETARLTTSENSDSAGNGEDTTPLEAAPRVAHGLPAEVGQEVETVEEDAESQKVESIGAEDALEEVPRPRRSQRRSYKIQEVI